MTDRSSPGTGPLPFFPGEEGWTPAHRREWQREADWVEAELAEMGELEGATDTTRFVVLVRRRRRARRMLRAIDLSLSP